MNGEANMSEGKELSRIAEFVRDRVEELKGIRNQREIAEIAGYTNQNMITMIKQGFTKVALDRVFLLAKALDADPKMMMRMALEQFYSPLAIRDMEQALGVAATRNEIRILEHIRNLTKGSDPALTPELKDALKSIFVPA
jgi:hypothetical protein